MPMKGEFMSVTLPRSFIATVMCAVALVFTTGADAATKHNTVKTVKTAKKHTVRKVRPHTVIAPRAAHSEPVTVAEPVEVEVHAPADSVDRRPTTPTNIGYRDTQVPTRTQHSERDVTCLAKNIYYEAGSEPRAGKVAVAQVTLNRVRSGKFADSICGVVYQKSQFSWVREARRKLNLNDNRYQESLEVALAVLNGDELLANMTEALYFHNISVRPAWGKPRVGRIGNHIFYRDKTPIINEDI